MMRRRRVLVTVGLLLATLLALALVLPLLVPAERLRDRLAAQVAEATGARATLGDASVRLLPRPSLRLADGRVAGTGRELAARRGNDLGLVDYAAELDALDVEFALGPLLRGRLEVAGLRLAVSRLSLRTGKDEVLCEDAVLTVDELRPPAGAREPVAGAGPVAPGRAIPDDVYLRGDLAIARLTVQRALYADVRAAAELDGRLLTVETVRAVRAGGPISGRAEFDWERDPWGELVFACAAKGVPATALLAPWAPEVGEKLATELVAEASGRCRLRDRETALATLDVTGRASADDGVVHAGEWLREVRPYLGDRQDLVAVRFTRLEHLFRIERGRYLVQELAVDGPDTDWRGAGWVGLDGTIGLDLGVKLPPGFTPDLGGLSFMADAVRDADGRITLDLRLTGRSARPDVSLDLAQLKKSAQDNVGGFLDKLRNR